MQASKASTQLPFCVLAAALCGAGQSAHAHTTIKDKEVNESSSTYTATAIGHGCDHPTKLNAKGKPVKMPVIAHSLVIPTVSPVITRDDGTAPALSDVIDAAKGTGTLAGRIDLIQDRNIFNVQAEKYDENGNVIGFHAKGGKLDTTLRGLVPFRFSAPKFKSTSCVKSMKVVMAVADICTMKFPPDEHSANLWIPETTATFSNGGIHGIGEATSTITVKRTQALDASCNGGYDITVKPSDVDVDANLPFAGWKTNGK